MTTYVHSIVNRLARFKEMCWKSKLIFCLMTAAFFLELVKIGLIYK